ncbi:MAG: hypothetical protein KAT58_08790, partial [candidate division Zixibacteria bacterium]|nr:hypothetical protein [candidate division Zixibacteria bacterium]
MIRVKIIAISLAAILIVGCSSSDDELILNFRKLPLPTGEDITGIHFPDDDLGYAVTAAGSILKTVDGGETFAVLDFHAAARLEDAFFLDDD